MIPKLKWLKTTIDYAQFVWARNLGVAYLGDVGSPSFMRLQSGCRLVPMSSEGSTGAENLLPRWSLTWPLAAWASLRHGSQLPPEQVIQEKDQEWKLLHPL